MSIIGGNRSFWLEGPETRLKYFGQRCPLGACIPQLGNSTIICKNGGIAWLVAPMSTEVSRNWYCSVDAVTKAIAVTSVTTGWFVPTIGQLPNPGYLPYHHWHCIHRGRCRQHHPANRRGRLPGQRPELVSGSTVTICRCDLPDHPHHPGSGRQCADGSTTESDHRQYRTDCCDNCCERGHWGQCQRLHHQRHDTVYRWDEQ